MRFAVSFFLILIHASLLFAQEENTELVRLASGATISIPFGWDLNIADTNDWMIISKDFESPFFTMYDAPYFENAPYTPNLPPLDRIQSFISINEFSFDIETARLEQFELDERLGTLVEWQEAGFFHLVSIIEFRNGSFGLLDIIYNPATPDVGATILDVMQSFDNLTGMTPTTLPLMVSPPSPPTPAIQASSTLIPQIIATIPSISATTQPITTPTLSIASPLSVTITATPQPLLLNSQMTATSISTPTIPPTASSTTPSQPTVTNTMLAPTCFLSRRQGEAPRIHTGIGRNRAVVALVRTDNQYQPITTGIDENGDIWWQFDVLDIASGIQTNEVWVAGEDLDMEGDCTNVPSSQSADPIVTIEPSSNTNLDTGAINISAGIWTIQIQGEGTLQCGTEPASRVGPVFASYLITVSPSTNLQTLQFDQSVLTQIRTNQYQGNYLFEGQGVVMTVNVIQENLMTGNFVAQDERCKLTYPIRIVR